MNLKFLETFIWVARLQSFSSAAEKLNATQAAISSRIKALEDSLGVRLFDRDMRSIVSLTPEGRNALASAEELVRLSKEFIANVSDKNAIRGVLTIGTMDAVVQAWLPQFIIALQGRFPMVQCNIVIGSSRDLFRQLQDGALDVCIVSAQASPALAKSLYLGIFQWAWIASPSLGFPEGDISLHNLARYPIITFPAGTPSHEEVMRLLQSAEINARIYTSNSTTTITQLVVHGAGVSLVPLVGIREMISSGALRVLPVTTNFPPFTYWASYIERPGDALPKIAVQIAWSIAQNFSAD